MALLKFLFSAFNSLGEDLLSKLVDHIFDFISDSANKIKLNKLISKQTEEESAHYINNSEFIDFETIALIIQNSVSERSSLEIIIGSDEERRNRFIKYICDTCNQELALKDSSSFDAVNQTVNKCYQVVEKFFFDQVPNEYFVLIKRTAADIKSSIYEAKQEIIDNDNKNKKELIENENRNAQNILDAIHSNPPISPIVPIEIQSENIQYLGVYNEVLFLEEAGSKVTLKNMYIEPMVEETDETISEYLTKWLKSEYGFLILYGTAGIGKTSLVARLIDKACSAEGCSTNPNNASVLAVALRNHCDLISQYSKPYSAKEILCKLYGVSDLRNLKGKLLILDGFDELTVLIPEFDKFQAAEFIDELNLACKNTYYRIHIMITSREGYFFGCTANKATLFWKEKQVKEWCDNYSEFKPTSNKWCLDFYKQFLSLPRDKGNDKLYVVLCVPFILYLCSNGNVDLSIHKTVGQIYDQAFRTILTRKHGKNLIGAERFNIRKQGNSDEKTDEDWRLVFWQFTKELAYQMFLVNELILSEEGEPDSPMLIGMQRAKTRTIKILQEKHKIPVSEKDLCSPKFLAVFSFARSDGHSGITFVHKTVYEYFTALKLYEDYLSKISESRTKSMSSEMLVEEIMYNTIEAFRYKAIPEEIFGFLIDICNEARPPFGTKDGSGTKWFNFDYYKEILLNAFKEQYECKLEIKPPVEEYFSAINPITKDHEKDYDQVRKSSISFQISRAFCNLTWFLTKQGFHNFSEEFRWCNDAVFSSSDQPVNMQGWDLSRFDLSNANLMGAILSKADFTKSRFSEANLSNSILSEAILANANMTESNLTAADLSQADLSYTNFQSAILRKSKLTGAIFDHTILTGADLSEIDFSNVDLTYVDLRTVRLTNSIFTGVTMYGANLAKQDLRDLKMGEADLQKANLHEADLRETYLCKAKLMDANLYGANLRGAYLNHTDFRGADLRGADLRGNGWRRMILTNTIFTGAKYSDRSDFPTLFPEGFNPKDYGMILDNYGIN